MTGKVITRREFLERAAVVGAAVGAGSLLVACGGNNTANGNTNTGAAAGDGEQVALDCTDTSALTETELATREGLQYVDVSVTADQNCANCQHYEASDDAGTCGGCALVPGLISLEGWCMSWAEVVS